MRLSISEQNRDTNIISVMHQAISPLNTISAFNSWYFYS